MSIKRLTDPLLSFPDFNKVVIGDSRDAANDVMVALSADFKSMYFVVQSTELMIRQVNENVIIAATDGDLGEEAYLAVMTLSDFKQEWKLRNEHNAIDRGIALLKELGGQTQVFNSFRDVKLLMNWNGTLPKVE